MDDRLLDQMIPLPDEEEWAERIFDELADEGFAVTNTRSGGIFYTIVRIAVRLGLELKQLARQILKNMYINTAEDVWMELKAADYGKGRKLEQKTKGYVTVGRTNEGEAVKILKGYLFKTQPDLNGSELKYIALEEVVLQKGALAVTVPVEAELAGAEYNVPEGQITRCIVHIEGTDYITNTAEWIIQEGADIEDIESLRERTSRSWAELSTQPIRDKYKNVAESVPGVFHAEIYDQHPRGQGTIDIVITGTAGAATQMLLDQVTDALDQIRGPYDNLLIIGSEIVRQDVSVTLTIPASEHDAGIMEQANQVISELLSIRKGRKLNELTQADMIFALKSAIPILSNIKVMLPAADVILEKKKVIAAGEISIQVLKS